MVSGDSKRCKDRVWAKIGTQVLARLPLTVARYATLCAPLAFTVGSSVASTISYVAESISARVVDATSGAPLPDVNVVAGWEAKGGMEGGNVVGWIVVMEAITDVDGMFQFPAWGPKRNETRGFIGPGSPLLLVFKPGYEFAYLYDRSPRGADGKQGNIRYVYGGGTTVAHMRSYWNGKTIRMKKSTASLQVYATQLSPLDIKLNSLLANDECNWKSIPKFLWAVHIQNQAFAGSTNVRQLTSLDELGGLSKRCGSLRSYVEANGR